MSAVQLPTVEWVQHYSPRYRIVGDYDVRSGNEPKEFLGYNKWDYSGKGPRWYCYKCRRARRKLYSKLLAADDPSYGLTLQTQRNQQTYFKFAFQWFCYDCLVAKGVIW